jgi:hypothetical protein
MSIININDMSKSEHRTMPNRIASPSHQQAAVRLTRPVQSCETNKTILTNCVQDSSSNEPNRYTSDRHESVEHNHGTKLTRKYSSSSCSDNDNDSAKSEHDHRIAQSNDDEHERSSSLNDHARRLLLLGTIRPSKTFYKHMSDADAGHLMDYFRQMKANNQRVTSDEINEELGKQTVEYKSKICT